MARKSRYGLTVPKPETKQYLTGVYLRLSVEDESSESINSQQFVVEEYLKLHDDLELVKFYIDNGISSFDAARPAFDEMMEDMKRGAINCIVVKDISRFGRSYIESAEYIENIFPFMNIRFISIAEAYDSLLSPITDMSVLLKTLINNAYSWDLSEKVKSIIQNKQQNGTYIPAKLPYGYRKERTESGTQWVIDSEKANIVLEIFTCSANGNSTYEIAGLLNQRDIQSPNGKLWTACTVGRIIKNQSYIGNFITGKTQTELTSIRQIIKIDPAEQIVFENHHIPIVNCELFTKAQRKRKIPVTSNAAKNEPPDLFKGKVFCGKCGRKMKRKIYNGKQKSVYYICPAYEEAKGSCDRNRITLEKLKTDVFNTIKLKTDEAVLLYKKAEETRSSIKHKLRNQHIQNKMDHLRSEIEEHKKLKIIAFEEYSLRIGLEKEDYLNKVKFEKKYLDFLQNSFCDIISMKNEENKQVRVVTNEVERFLCCVNKTELDGDMISTLVEKVLVAKGLSQVMLQQR